MPAYGKGLTLQQQALLCGTKKPHEHARLRQNQQNAES